MANARSEQIMVKIEAALQGLPMSGDRVQRGQVYPHEAAQLPALSIMTGPDVPELEFQNLLVDWILTVYVQTVLEMPADYTTPSSTIETDLATMRKEVYAAVMSDYTLGLDFVVDVTPGAVTQPALDGEGNLPIGSQVLSFEVHYRTDRQDISQ